MGKSCSFALQYPIYLCFPFWQLTMTMSMRSIAYGKKLFIRFAISYLSLFSILALDYDYVYEVNCLWEKAVHSLCNILFIFVFHFGSMTMTMSMRSIAYGKKLFIRFAISYLSLFSILAL